jgi:hypothetical protein
LEARRAAVAGLFNSWASPAAIVPSDASFSRCWEYPSMFFTRVAIVRKTWLATEGHVLSICQNSFLRSRNNRLGFNARTVARLGLSSKRDISPMNIPGFMTPIRIA